MTYDTSKIGACLAWAGEDFVFTYGDDSVIKFSKFDLITSREKAQKRFIADFGRAKQYFGRYVLDTEMAVSPSIFHIAKIQRRIIEGRPLHMRDMQVETVRLQFKEILASFDAISSQNVVIDLIGLKGVFFDGFSNIFITPTQDLIIIDVTLLGINRYPWPLRPLMYVPLIVFRAAQEYRLKRFRRAVS